MENNNNYSKLTFFKGEGGQLFNIYIVNMVLTVFTLGFYYPWARAAMLRYIYQETEFAGSRFTFHGTGNEMFIGFIKGVGIVLGLYLIAFLSIFSGSLFIMTLGSLIFLVGIFCLMPVAVHGAMRYRLSRTSWRGIHFWYEGTLGTLISEFLSGIFLTIFTFGIYSSWFTIRIRTYVIDNIRFGNTRFSYMGNGTEYFILNLKGNIFTIFTLGIYFFWWMRDLFNFYVNNIQIIQADGKVARFRSTMTGGGYFGLMFVNVLLLVFTLGLASPWVTVRTLRFVMENVAIEDTLDVDAIEQGGENYKNIRNDDIADILDIGIA